MDVIEALPYNDSQTKMKGLKEDFTFYYYFFYPS